MLKHSRPFGLLVATLLALSAGVATAGPDTGVIPRPRPPQQCSPHQGAQSPCCERNPFSPGCMV